MKLPPDSKMVIRTQTLDEFAQGMRQHARALDAGASLPSESAINFESADAMLAHFTPRRVKLLDTLARHGAMPVAQLAGSVRRTESAVDRDLMLLEKIGAIKLRATGAGSAKKAYPLAAKYELVYTLGIPKPSPAKRPLYRAS